MGVGGRKEMGALRSWSAPSPTRSAQVDRHNHLWRGRSAEAKAQETTRVVISSSIRSSDVVSFLSCCSCLSSSCFLERVRGEYPPTPAPAAPEAVAPGRDHFMSMEVRKSLVLCCAG